MSLGPSLPLQAYPELSSERPGDADQTHHRLDPMNEQEHQRAAAREAFGRALEDASDGFRSVRDDVEDLYGRLVSDASDVSVERSAETARRIAEDARAVAQQLVKAATDLDAATHEDE